MEDGHALLTDGNQVKEPDNKTNIEMDNQENTEINKREAYLQELQDMSQYDNIDVSKEQENDTKIIDQILENYNGNLLEQAEIDKEDLGIILQTYVGNGHIIKDISETGEISYIQNASKITYDLEPGQEWVEENAVGNVYILVDTEHNNTVAGIGLVEGNYCEIDVEQVRTGQNEGIYEKNDETYVGLPEGVDNAEAYKNFSNYYQERVEKQQATEKNEGMEH